MDAWIVLDSYDVPSSSSPSSPTSVSSGPNLKEVSSSEPEQDQPTSTTTNEGDEKIIEAKKVNDLMCELDQVCIPTSSTNLDGEKFLKPSNTIRLSHRDGVNRKSEVSSNYEKFVRLQKSYPNILNQGIFSMSNDLMNAGAYGLECFRAISNQGRSKHEDLEGGIFLKPQDTRFVKSGYEWSPAVGGVKANISPSNQNGQATGVPKPEPKPVECNLCHRKFKNIPALNGHMRLHGGYFKKDSDAKKCEKKEVTGPPLQTASMSVRALIEEKIIQKRITNPQNGVTITNENNGVRTVPPQLPNTPPGNNQEPDLNIKLSSFVVPAPPVQTTIPPSEKLRRHSDSEHFLPPRAPSGVQQEAQALAELLLKRGKKLSVKRASSDPGAQVDPSSPLQLSASSSPGPPLQLSFQSADYSLSGVTYQAEDGGYFSPNLQEDVFQQVSADSMLLQGVDPNQLAESLQFQASLLQDQSDQLSLEEYQGSHNQDLQAVLNSPLPVSLAEFGAYGSSQTQSPKDLQYHQDSPLQQTKDFVNYVNSPHPSLATQSPLPSPITHHDSPSFTYPTPPASQEGQSPSFGQGLLGNSLRMSSPQQSNDSFVQSVIAHGGGPVPVSSPLSAAFYTSTMSSAAAVEAALSEVLPLDNQNSCNGPVRLGMYQPSPPPHSPLSGTPVPSPLSLSSVPASSSSVSSPLPQAAFNTSQTHNSFPLSPQQTLQSQMMPNSDDPLLSSSPKDFASRKRFDFNGVHSFKLIGNGMVDLGNGGLGIMVDTNGELKIFQAATPQQAKSLVMSGAAIINATSGSYVRKVESGTPIRISGKSSPAIQHFATSQNVLRNQRPKLHVTLENLKEEIEDDVFLSPSSIPASPSRVMRRRSARSDPFHSSSNHHPCHHSRLRTPRIKECGTPPPYTPAPMLSPSRSGQGLYWQATAPVTSCSWPTSTTVHSVTNGISDRNEFSDSPPESDANPRINIGSKHQAIIPNIENDRTKLDREPSYEHLLWDPGIGKLCTDSEIEMYLEFACCAAVPGGGRNKEYALHLLNMCHGNIHEAMLKLMQPTPWLPPGHPLLAYEYAESDRWSADEVDAFHQGLLKFDKDFRTIAHEIGSKTIKQCIQFYYLWKKICPEEYKRLRLLRRRKESEPIKTEMDLDYDDIKIESDIRHSSPANDVDLVSTSSESRLFVCEYTDCSASFNSRAALSGHIRIHGGTLGGRAPTPDRRGTGIGDSLEEFPCKICGKIFNKVKSRSAHMKSHRPPDAEPKKPKLEPHKVELSEQSVGRTVGVTSSSLPVSRLT